MIRHLVPLLAAILSVSTAGAAVTTLKPLKT